MKSIKFEYKITIIYLIIGVLWIIYSDAILNNLISSDNLLTIFQSIKGIFYVFATTLLLYFLIKRNSDKQNTIEEKLKESTEKYKSLYEQAPLAYQSLNIDGKVIDINPQWCSTLGYNREEILGKWFGDFLHDDYVEHFRTNFPQFKKRGYINDVQFRMKKKDGSFIYVSFEGCIGYTSDGKFKQTYCTFKDITAEYLANIEIKENEERFKSLFYDNISYMILLDSESGQILDANKAALDFYGYSLEEFKSLKVFNINTSSKEDVEEKIKNVLNKQRNYFQHKHKLANGEIRDVEVYSSKIKVHGRTLLYAIINDITKQLQTEIELIKAKEKAEESDRLKSSFLANMSHEIRTPLNGVLGFANLLSEEVFPPDTVQQYASIINSSGQRLLELINNILDISRIESGSMPITITKYSPSASIDEVIALFEINAQNKNLKIERNISSDHENILFISDQLKVEQVLMNLVNNAIKFCKDGIIKVGYTTERDFITYSVTDNGSGIPEEVQDQLFERFYQVNKSLSRGHEGSGLGLALCKSLVELLHGKIWVESKPNNGAKFFFTLPKLKDLQEKETSETESTKDISLLF